MKPTIAYVALGSNLGDRRAVLESALEALRSSEGIWVLAVSTIIETEPVGPAPMPDQPRYLNAAATLSTSLPPRELLARLLEIEAMHGRVRGSAGQGGTRWGPRTLDLDLLLYADQIIDEPGLKVPHPRLHEREFVLGPLAEIAPDVIHPICGQPILSLLEKRCCA